MNADVPKHRFFVPPETLSGGEPVALPPDLSRQIRTVLRLRPGTRVALLDGEGYEYLAELADLRGETAVVRVLERSPAPGEPRLHLTLYAALLKGQHLEWVLQKGTELGVSAFVPLVTSRTVVRDTGRMYKKRERWERILREAAEQCRRGRLPGLADPLPFDEACVEAASNHERAFMPYVLEQAVGLGDAVAALARQGTQTRPPRLALLIGPEGGFDEDEARQARESGIQLVTLGPRTLRAETAALAAAAIVMDRWGELGR